LSFWAAELVSLAAWHVAFRTRSSNRGQHTNGDRGNKKHGQLLHWLDPKQTFSLKVVKTYNIQLKLSIQAGLKADHETERRPIAALDQGQEPGFACDEPVKTRLLFKGIDRADGTTCGGDVYSGKQV
jgi:hypothetical protein